MCAAPSLQHPLHRPAAPSSLDLLTRPGLCGEHERSVFAAAWLGLFSVGFFIVGIVGLHGTIKSLLYPPQIVIDKAGDEVLVRFWGGTTKYDHRARVSDLEVFEVLDSGQAAVQSVATWEGLSITGGWYGSPSAGRMRRLLQWVRNKECVLGQRASVQAEKTASKKRDIEGNGLHGQSGGYRLNVIFRNRVYRVVDGIDWEHEPEARTVADRLATFIRT